MKNVSAEQKTAQHIAVIGGGWAGLAAAVRLTQAGHSVTLFEAAPDLGGRARAVSVHTREEGEVVANAGHSAVLDNGQHIMLAAYRESLDVMRVVGVDAATAFERMRLDLRRVDGSGLRGTLLGFLCARDWSWQDRGCLLQTMGAWALRQWSCEPELTVAILCSRLTPVVMRDFIEPLCLSALNTPLHLASAQVFLRVLHEAWRGGTDVLLPRVTLSELFPKPAAQWLKAQGASVYAGCRIESIACEQGLWKLSPQLVRQGGSESAIKALQFDRIVLACPPWEAARLTTILAPDWSAQVLNWSKATPYQPIATVYVLAPLGFELVRPMCGLVTTREAPAQFVFQRAERINGRPLLAFVVSVNVPERSLLTQQVLSQGQAALGVALQHLTSIVEKRATFACTPPNKRPAACAAPRLYGRSLMACGDYVFEPYPATLEAAVRSARQVI